MAAVVVLGSVNTDLVVAGSRLPRAGETVIGGRFERHQGGKGGNQAVAAARAIRGAPGTGAGPPPAADSLVASVGAAPAGAAPAGVAPAGVAIVGAVGDDAFGLEAVAALEAEGIDCSALAVLPGTATGVALVVVDEAGENQIAVAPGANSTLAPADVETALRRLLDPGSVLLACLEVPMDAVRAGGMAARAAGARFVLNPAPAREVPEDVLRLADVVTPNQHEIEALLGASGGPRTPRGEPGDDPIAGAEDAARALVARFPGLHCVLTLGSRGAWLVGSEAPRGRRFAAVPLSPVDTTGAGDALNGALAAALAEGRPLAEAVARGVAAGGLATGRVGAREALPYRDEIIRATRLEREG